MVDFEAQYQADSNKESRLRLAHTLKGIAGSIGAITLQEHAKNLESAITQDDFDKQTENLTILIKNLLNTINSIQKALPEIEQSTPIKKQNINLTDELEKIAKCIDDFDTQALTIIENILENNDDKSLEAKLSKLEKALQKYDFDMAKLEVEKLKHLQIKSN